MIRGARRRVQLCSMGCGFPATERIGLTALCERGCAGRGECRCQMCGRTWTRKIISRDPERIVMDPHGCRWCGYLDRHELIRLVEAKLLLAVTPPPGPAPDHIRCAWIGLPLVQAEGSRPDRISAGGEQNYAGPGLTVDTYQAGCVLRQAEPEAVKWWDADPNHALHHWRDLVFPPECFAR